MSLICFSSLRSLARALFSFATIDDESYCSDASRCPSSAISVWKPSFVIWS
jgi:hypothetical protein